MSDQAPRSAFEIAMERLRQKDAQDGVDHQPRTDEQKAAIAEVRSFYDAKIAQAEVLYRSAVVGILDETARARLFVPEHQAHAVAAKGLRQGIEILGDIARERRRQIVAQ